MKKLGGLFGGSKITRILYGSDFHGSDLVFRKFIAAGIQYKVQALIVGGDITGKAMVPVIHNGAGVYKAELFGRHEHASNPDELEKLKKTVSNVGFYPIVLEKDQAEELENNPDLMSHQFELEMCKRVRDWMVLAEDKLTPHKLHLYFMPGNDDLYSVDKEIEGFTYVHNPDMKLNIIDDYYHLIGNSNANMTPWACERDLEEADLQKKLDEVAGLVQDPNRTILAIHVPPHDSKIDACPDLDKELRVITRGSQVVMKSAGSPAVRSLIEKVQPLLALHGHIHESPGHTRIGRTLCINAGSEYAEGIMKAAIINLEGEAVKGHMLTSA